MKILEYGPGDKLKKINSNIETNVKHNDEFIEHSLQVLSNGVYQLKFLPSNKGDYHVTFFKDGHKIDGLQNNT